MNFQIQLYNSRPLYQRLDDANPDRVEKDPVQTVAQDVFNSFPWEALPSELRFRVMDFCDIHTLLNLEKTTKLNEAEVSAYMKLRKDSKFMKALSDLEEGDVKSAIEVLSTLPHRISTNHQIRRIIQWKMRQNKIGHDTLWKAALDFINDKNLRGLCLLLGYTPEENFIKISRSCVSFYFDQNEIPQAKNLIKEMCSYFNEPFFGKLKTAFSFIKEFNYHDFLQMIDNENDKSLKKILIDIFKMGASALPEENAQNLYFHFCRLGSLELEDAAKIGHMIEEDCKRDIIFFELASKALEQKNLGKAKELAALIVGDVWKKQIANQFQKFSKRNSGHLLEPDPKQIKRA